MEHGDDRNTLVLTPEGGTRKKKRKIIPLSKKLEAVLIAGSGDEDHFANTAKQYGCKVANLKRWKDLFEENKRSEFEQLGSPG